MGGDGVVPNRNPGGKIVIPMSQEIYLKGRIEQVNSAAGAGIGVALSEDLAGMILLKFFVKKS